MEKFRDPADPLWEQRVVGLESGTQLEKGAITPEKLNKELPGRRLILQAPFWIKEKTKIANTSFFLGEGNLLEGSGTTEVTVTEKPIVIFQFLEAAYKTTGKTTKMVLEVHFGQNETEATGAFTFGLFKVTEVTGAEKTFKVKTEARLAASKIAIETPAKTFIRGEANFPVLTNESTYVIGVNVAAETAAKSLCSGLVQLFVVNE